MASQIDIDTQLDSAAVAAIDAGGQISDTLALGEQLRDAMWKTESAGLDQWESPGGLVVAGMGGSSIGGLLARAALADQACRPIVTTRCYELPAWTTDQSTVLCASYSGNTEETLACFEAAGVIGSRRVVATSGGQLGQLAREEGVPVVPLAGGLQPRVAVGYLLVAILEVAAKCGAGPSLHAEIDVAADHLDQLASEWAPSGPENSLPKELARKLHGTIPVILGYGLSAAAAYRWKCQINENAEMPAFASELPEAGHNELVGWGSANQLGKFSSVILADTSSHPRLQKRADVYADLVTPTAAGVYKVDSIGNTAVERILSLVLLGDLVSTYLAVLNGVDPGPVNAIDSLKAALGSSE